MTPDQRLPPPEPPTAGARVGFAITNLTKLSGLVLALNEALLHEPLRPVVMGIAAFMMAGAQGLESLLGFLTRPPPK